MDQHWKDIIAEQGESGLTAVRFCKDKNINKSKFYYWKKKLSVTQESLSGFVTLSVKPSHENSNIVVEYPNGVKLHLQGKVSQSQLRELIHV